MRLKSRRRKKCRKEAVTLSHIRLSALGTTKLAATPNMSLRPPQQAPVNRAAR
jgi:hypothetical protein